ncbi:catalase-like [Colias croceus]|uniref:catalase-like n=1 Tax=Colias crocea TaxID=72248 RepID=UPI001E27D306|nr:catalase-like [Colias croceus]
MCDICPLKWLCLVLLSVCVHSRDVELDPVRDQIELFRERNEKTTVTMTTSSGAPVERRDTSTLNRKLIYNNFFMDSITHVIRERIPERTIHAKGAGAFGYFEVTHNVEQYTKADFLNGIGKRTPVAVRFSPTVIERGGSDLFRGTRGFAVKFYTKEGNFDFVGFSTPMFFLKDPVLFPTCIRSQRKNPATAVRDSNVLWDFMTLYPESISTILTTLGDEGIPKGYRHMNGFSIHTYQLQNKFGDIYFARLHFISDIGKASITTEEARIFEGTDPDVFTRDLYEAIACGKKVSWTFSIQVMSLKQALNLSIDVFDLTLEIPEDLVPLVPVGRLVLDRNPLNQFAEVEQLAFCPCNLVPGIDGAPDKTFEARSFVYRDAHLYRLGPNFNNIKVNCPFYAHTYNRDGHAPVRDNEKDSPNYYENSFNGPVAYNDTYRADLIDIFEGKSNNFAQTARIYQNMSKGEKDRVISNIMDTLVPALPSLHIRAVKTFKEIDPELGGRIEKALKEYKREAACTLPFEK